MEPAHESPRGVDDANLDRQTANFVDEGYYELKDLLEDDIWESNSSIPQSLRQKVLKAGRSLPTAGESHEESQESGTRHRRSHIFQRLCGIERQKWIRLVSPSWIFKVAGQQEKFWEERRPRPRNAHGGSSGSLFGSFRGRRAS